MIATIAAPATAYGSDSMPRKGCGGALVPNGTDGLATDTGGLLRWLRDGHWLAAHTDPATVLVHDYLLTKPALRFRRAWRTWAASIVWSCAAGEEWAEPKRDL
jgi:hypothetical protein